MLCDATLSYVTLYFVILFSYTMLCYGPPRPLSCGERRTAALPSLSLSCRAEEEMPVPMPMLPKAMLYYAILLFLFDREEERPMPMSMLPKAMLYYAIQCIRRTRCPCPCLCQHILSYSLRPAMLWATPPSLLWRDEGGRPALSFLWREEMSMHVPTLCSTIF